MAVSSSENMKIVGKNVSLYYLMLAVLAMILTFLLILQFFPFSFQSSPNQIKIGIVDSGCSSEQSEYVSQYVSFTNTSYGYGSDDMQVYDTLNHGEHTCQLLINHMDDTIKDKSVINIISAKIAHSDGTLTYDGLFAAVDWLITKDVDIINLSLGSDSIITEEMMHSFEEFSEQVIFVAASGNKGSSAYMSQGKGDWPAMLPWVVGVGAYQDTIDNPADFTISGRSYFGDYVSEFSADGFYGSLGGTSIATPIVTAKIVNLMYQLEQEDFDMRPSEILAIFTKTAAHWDDDTNLFDNYLGWSVPVDDYDFDELLDPSFIINGPNELDIHSRLVGESWELSWKTYSYGIDVVNLEFGGNGSELISAYDSEFESWGGKLNVKFSASDHAPGFYNLEIINHNGNNLNYSFNLVNNTKGRVLLDHRAGINGYGHPYGEFSQLESIIRHEGFIVEHAIYPSNPDLGDYDAIIVPNIFGILDVSGREFASHITEEILEQYSYYMSKGGNLMALTDVPERTNSDGINSFINPYGLNYTNEKISSNSNEVTIYNITASELMDGISNINFFGGEIVSFENKTQELGWYTKTIVGPFQTISIYQSIGADLHPNGSLLLFGSTYTITNKNLVTLYYNHFDAFIVNYLNRILN